MTKRREKKKKKTINELNVTLLQNLNWWKCEVILSYLHCHGNYTKEKKIQIIPNMNENKWTIPIINLIFHVSN